MESAALEVERCIKVREKWKEELHTCVENMPKRKESMMDLILLYRAATIDVVQSITKWRCLTAMPLQPYLYQDKSCSMVNYLLTLCDDMKFLDTKKESSKWLKTVLDITTFNRNPFLLPLNLDGEIQSRLKMPFAMAINSLDETPESLHVQGNHTQDFYEINRILLLEEGLYGHAPREINKELQKYQDEIAKRDVMRNASLRAPKDFLKQHNLTVYEQEKLNSHAIKYVRGNIRSICAANNFLSLFLIGYLPIH